MRLRLKEGMGHIPSAKATKAIARGLGMGGSLSESSRVLTDSIYHMHRDRQSGPGVVRTKGKKLVVVL
jgi:hypothetical protein